MRRAHGALTRIGVLALLIAGCGLSAALAAPPAPVARVEARSAQLLAVGTVRGENMIIHLTRIEDNAPIGNAQIALVLRGATHPAVSLADGGYSVDTSDLALPGAAAVRFEVTLNGARQDLSGTLQVAGRSDASDDDKSSSRQIGWWVLNFAVCIGFLWLWSRRKRHDPDEAAQ